MILITVIIGSVVLSATVIAGFLISSELRQANNAISSGMAVFAADSGVEKALLEYYRGGDVFNLKEGSPKNEIKFNEIVLLNNARAVSSLKCVGEDKITKVDCTNNDLVYGFIVRSIGTLNNTERILETLYVTRYN